MPSDENRPSFLRNLAYEYMKPSNKVSLPLFIIDTKTNRKRGRAAREDEAREADRKILELTRYRDALVKDGCFSKPSGSQGAAPRARKRTMSPTPPSLSPSRSPPTTYRRREAVRAGKGKTWVLLAVSQPQAPP